MVSKTLKKSKSRSLSAGLLSLTTGLVLQGCYSQNGARNPNQQPADKRGPKLASGVLPRCKGTDKAEPKIQMYKALQRVLDFHQNDYLGSGGGGVVYRANVRSKPKETVAVKLKKNLDEIFG